MDLLALSGGLVPAAAKRKAVRKWAGRRQFWACIDGDFAASMGAIGSGGRIWQCHHQEDARTCVVIEGHQGRREWRDEGDQKSVCVCVCFWPPVPKWGPVRHEIPISSPPLDDIPSIP
jgi:hypothetical protein